MLRVWWAGGGPRMARFCITNASGYEPSSLRLTNLLLDRGHEIVDAGDLASANVDALIFCTPARVTDDVATQWLSIVNKAPVDVIVTEAMSSSLAPDLTLSITAFASRSEE